jgi:hypothetical protein
MILKQELKARSAVAVGLAAAAAWMLFFLATGDVDVWTAIFLPIFFGVAVWLLGVGWSGARRARRLRNLTELFTRVEPSSPEWTWFERAWLTTTRLRKLARHTLPEPFASRLCEQAETTARDLYRLAGQVSELTRRMKLLNGARLAGEATRLRVRPADADAAAATKRSLSAVSDTQAVLDRLAAAREAALARLAADTHVLEGLHARTLELGALVRSSPSPLPNALDDLAIELDGLRQGMSEAVQLSRDALGATTEVAEPQISTPSD